ncbi:protein Efr3p [[Candida] railenensis]|uniref:Protein EFR3 n=1 Tax=[Candida] railenensis TaxID=45579 RepID=A0A9P0QRA0_9ASCO|nr:protein Efr3p [[Candida] railenensis]
MGLLHSKHQKLILQCYPPGKAVDKKPNPSELSYLLYYASTRRVKLEKVMTFIQQKAKSDVNRTRAGNLQVTLSIISALIEKCSDNLNVFANAVCIILSSILTINDVALAKGVVRTYGVLCSKLDGELFSGDKLFLDSFTELSKSLINKTKTSKADSSPNSLDWKIISVLACGHVSNCIGYNGKLAGYFTSVCIPLCVSTIEVANTTEQLKDKLPNHDSSVPVAPTATKLKRYSTVGGDDSAPIPPKNAVIASITAKLIDDSDSSNITEEDLEEGAFVALKSFFDTTSISQISESTKVVVQHYNSPKEHAWISVLLELCINWVPVQLRFVLLSTLLNKLTAVSDKADASNPNYKVQIQFANYILGLMSSEVNMIGLSVSDVIQHLLSLQTNVVLKQHSFLDEKQTSSLLKVYSECICSLSTHVYYFDQVPDSVQEILIKLDSIVSRSALANKKNTAGIISPSSANGTAPVNAPHHIRVPSAGQLSSSSIIEPSSSSIPTKRTTTTSLSTSLSDIDADKLQRLVLTLLKNISKILTNLKKKPSSIARNHVQLEHWEVSLSLISPYSSFDGFDTNLMAPEITNRIQVEYLKVFRQFLSHEFYAQEDEEDFTDSKEVLSSSDARTFLTPNSNNLITESDNFLTHFFAHLDKLLHRPLVENAEVYDLVFKSMKDLINLLGINFFANFIPFFFHWIKIGSENSSPDLSKKSSAANLGNISDRDSSSNIRETLAYATMHYSLILLDSKYSQYLEDDHYCIHSTFFKSVETDITYRKSKGLWVEELYDTSSIAEQEMSESPISANKKGLYSFISNNEWISNWINPNSNLLLETRKKNHHHNGRGNGIRIQLNTGSKLETIESRGEIISENENGNKHRNGHGLADGEQDADNELFDDAGSNEDNLSTTTSGKHLGLGLGTVGDITSIHSEILNHHQQISHLFNSLPHQRSGYSLQRGGTDGSIVSENRHVVIPKVSDLKDVMSTREIFATVPKISFGPNFDEAPNSAKSVLSRQLVQTDIDLIIDGLESDDSKIVV